MNPETAKARRVQLFFALGFPLGALAHVLWTAQHGWLYHGHAPAWAVWFWYALCVADLLVCALMLLRPKLGLLAGLGVMALVVTVNWTLFPTFQFGFNAVPLVLTGFGLALALTAPWLWRRL